MRSFIIAAAATVLLSQHARANFVVASPLVAAQPSNPPDAAGAGDATKDFDHPTSQAPMTAIHPTRPHFIVSRGFGDQVPLGFAVRQIVPKAVKVSYGPGADPSATVDWKGGQGWNRVLSMAVKPLGYRLVMTHLAVEIRK